MAPRQISRPAGGVRRSHKSLFFIPAFNPVFACRIPADSDGQHSHSGISGQSCPAWKNGYFFHRNNLQIRPQRESFGRLQNGSPPFGTCAASHSSQKVCRLHVTLGQGQSSRMVGDMNTVPLAVTGLTFWNRKAKPPSSPANSGPRPRSRPSRGSPRPGILPVPSFFSG